jgi:hypothetical protein
MTAPNPGTGSTFVLTEVEALITSAGAGLDLTLLDRAALPEGAIGGRVLRGVHVDLPTTANTDLYRDRDEERVEDTVVVYLWWRLNPKAQKSTRNDAIEAADRIVGMLTSRGFHPEWHITHRTTERGIAPESTEVYRIVSTFTLTRDAALM